MAGAGVSGLLRVMYRESKHQLAKMVSTRCHSLSNAGETHDLDRPDTPDPASTLRCRSSDHATISS